MAAKKMKRLTIALPEDVWNRLQAEAFTDHKVSIGTHLTRLIVKRDAKRHPVSGNTGD